MSELKYTDVLPKGVKQHPIYHQYYMSKGGKVWSTTSNKWLKQYKISDGHLEVNLGSKNRHKSVHRLVLETYVGSCPEGMECRHLNGISDDNRLENLCWDTKSNNIKDNYKHGKLFGFNGTNGESHPNSKLSLVDIRMIIYAWGTKLFTQQEIANIYNVTKSNIQDIIYKKTWKHIWEN